MLDSLKTVLDIQELDMQMMRLMALKNKLLKKLNQIQSLKKDLQQQKIQKEQQIHNLKSMIKAYEEQVEESFAKSKQLEGKQSQVKKVEEFNALTQEIAATERSRNDIEQQVTHLVDQLVLEEELLGHINQGLQAAEEEGQQTELEMAERIKEINSEGRKLQNDRIRLVSETTLDILKTYERLFKNKKDRVIVPIENRTCSGCHIVLTAQHENLVRKGERLVFCEHCSRIHYWQEAEGIQDTAAATKRRRRRNVAA
ncbi:MAG: hypothetical protein K0S74_695 [Chlamydiales bacterium]|jgi:predicted  nucleic acid-binding Zn-ribbon protein|nr:hypothetical protein [Chlamydiales bacterium]